MYSLIKKIISFFISLFVLAYFLCATHYGLSLIFKGISYALPGKLSVTQLDGSLISGFHLRNLKYASPEIVVTLDTLHFKWTPLDLLNRKITIDQLRIDRMNVYLQEKESKHNQFKYEKLYLLNNLIIHHLLINQMKIAQNTTILFNPSRRVERTLLNVHTLEIKQQTNNYYSFKATSDQGNVDGIYRFNWQRTIAWEIIVNMHQLDLQTWIQDRKTNINAKITTNGILNSSNQKIEFHLKNLSGTLDQHAIKGNADVNYNNGKVLVDNLELAFANAFMKLSGTIDNYLKIVWQVKIPALQAITPDVKGQIYATGKINGLRNSFNVFSDLKAKSVNTPYFKIDTLDAKINSKNAGKFTASKISVKNLKSNGYIIPRVTTNVTARLLNNNLITHMEVLFDEKNQIRGDIQLDNIMSLATESPIRGNISLLFENLSKFIVTPYIKDLEGNLTADMKLSGKINHPTYVIDATFSEGQALIPKLNLYLKNINISSAYSSKQPILFTGTFNAGNGNARISGKFNPERNELPLELRLTGKHLQMLNLQEYKITASPDISVYINRYDTSIKGSLLDVSSKIHPKDFSTITTLPAETIVIGNKPVETSIPKNFSLQIQITLGNHNFISYDNLQTELTGNLFISQQSGRLPTANGELYTVNGSYRAYGNLLKITQGKLIYAGNLLNDPGLNIKAIKKIETTSFAKNQSQVSSEHKTESIYQGVKYITVGIDVAGTLKKPQVSFSSDPIGMSQNDILSYLLFGYPQSEIKNMNGFEILNKVATTLDKGPSKIDKIMKQIQNKFELKNLSFSSIETYNAEKNQSQSSTALNIEKQLNKKLYVRYRVGVFSAQSVLNIKYKINQMFSLQSESSSQSNGVDLLFEYEHD